MKPSYGNSELCDDYGIRVGVGSGPRPGCGFYVHGMHGCVCMNVYILCVLIRTCQGIELRGDYLSPSAVAPYFCRQAADLRHVTFTILQPLARKWN